MTSLKIGVLALQGAVEEHMVMIQRLGCEAKEIRMPEDLAGVDGLILPGGESTTMAIVGEQCGLFPQLKAWVQAKKPIWGTCAGMILLSDHAIKQAEGGQSLVGGLDVFVCRNFFGSQIYSREMKVELSHPFFQEEVDGGIAFDAVFIRAPAILKAGSHVQVLATIAAKPHVSAQAEVRRLLSLSEEEASGDIQVIVAVKQDSILATAFHPELTSDVRWHSAFVRMVREWKATA
eukprot:gene3465-3795_t